MLKVFDQVVGVYLFSVRCRSLCPPHQLADAALEIRRPLRIRIRLGAAPCVIKYLSRFGYVNHGGNGQAAQLRQEASHPHRGAHATPLTRRVGHDEAGLVRKV